MASLHGSPSTHLLKTIPCGLLTERGCCSISIPLVRQTSIGKHRVAREPRSLCSNPAQLRIRGTGLVTGASSSTRTLAPRPGVTSGFCLCLRTRSHSLSCRLLLLRRWAGFRPTGSGSRTYRTNPEHRKSTCSPSQHRVENGKYRRRRFHSALAR